MHRYQNLAVALPRTQVDPGLVRYAAMIANLGTVKRVNFIHVLASESGHSPAPSHDALAEMQAAVQGHFDDAANTVQPSFEVLHGPVLDQLLAYVAEQQIDLLLVGHRRYHLDHPRRYDLVRRLAMKAPCSLWVLPEESPATLSRILVPIDFSEPAADSMRVAVSMARLSGHSECLALSVFLNEGGITRQEYEEVFLREEEAEYEKFIAPINCRGVTVTPLFEQGVNVAHVISRIAKEHDVDLITMATRGRSRSAAILLGSVTEQVIMETRIPLLAVKHFGARMGVVQALLDRRFWQEGGIQTS